MSRLLFPEYDEEDVVPPKIAAPKAKPKVAATDSLSRASSKKRAKKKPKSESKAKPKAAPKPIEPTEPAIAFPQITAAPADRQRAGLLFIGDPHLEARVPGFRSDDFPAVALRKFRWCLDYARQNNLQPVLLGDLFQLPRDNPNWLLSEVFECLVEPLPAIYGNHDVRENTLNAHDSINLMITSGHLRLLNDEPWIGTVDSHTVVVGGSPWGTKVPREFDKASVGADLVVWATHHDITVPGYDAGRIRPGDRSGIDVVINGHIHRRLQTVSHGNTHWMTPGNITRRVRSDAARDHVPAVLVIKPTARAPAEHKNKFAFCVDEKQNWVAEWVEVPHAPFDEVFHGDVQPDEEETEASGFVAELKQLTYRRTETGAGLMQFLDANLKQFEQPVADEIMRLANEVTSGENDE